MQDHHLDAPFDDNKYHFPPGVLAPKPGTQPWLEVAPERDEQGTPGLQPIPHDEQKYVGGVSEAALPYRTHGAAHADELTSQGMQAVPTPAIVEPQYLAQSQPQFQPPPQPQYQWPESVANHYYGQSFQTVSSSHVSGHSGDNPMHSPQLAPSNPETHHLNPYTTPSPNPSWAKERRQALMGGDRTRAKRFMLWALIGAGLVVVGLGAVLGGVLGSKAEKASHSNDAPVVSNTTPNTTSNGTSSTIPNSVLQQPIRAGSKLAVTGYRRKGDYSIRLFFQDQDHQLRFIDRETSSSNWTKSEVLDNLPYQPLQYGAIAAGSYLFGTPAPKIEFFYEDKDGIIRGQNFNFEIENGTIPVQGEAGSVNMYPLQMAGGTRFSCYFPYLVSQDANNALRWTMMHGEDVKNPEAPWWVNDTNWGIKASKGGAMVALPVAQKFRNAGGIVYRSSEGMLSIQIQNETEAGNENAAWRKGALSKDVPPTTSIGAFSVGRPYDNNNQVNTYILYQDDDGIIQVVWQDDDSGWKGPKTYDALGDAEKGTEIVCLTAGVWGASNILSREQDMNRCFYFHVNGGVKEVWFDGNNWNDEGIVQIL
ncbi:hypothetical protein F5Y04DRAFT_19953 [Hypomontagnella monticulosa]|nr:hypothetical protein F5Y04DRAFT_19953 [Hypomontagnella monticulosa]